jgi:hypothetical protein
MKLLIMQSSPASHHFLLLRSNYFPQHPVFIHPQSVFFPLYERPNLTHIQNNSVVGELVKYKLDLVAVQEVRWEGEGDKIADSYIFFYGKGKSPIRDRIFHT